MLLLTLLLWSLSRCTTLCATTWCSTWSVQCNVSASPPVWPLNKGNWLWTLPRWSSNGSYRGSKTNRYVCEFCKYTDTIGPKCKQKSMSDRFYFYLKCCQSCLLLTTKSSKVTCWHTHSNPVTKWYVLLWNLANEPLQAVNTLRVTRKGHLSLR